MQKRLPDPVKTLVRFADFFILFLILVSVITFALETIPELDPEIRNQIEKLEVIITLVFTVEYLLRLFTSPHKLRFIFSFYGLLDLLAILPFYFSLAIDLRGIRIVRIMRVFRLLKLARYNKAIDNFLRAMAMTREEAIVFLLAIFIMLFISATGIYYFENEAQPENFKSIPHSLWWAVTTLTTVGYGDVYPITIGGRIFTFIVLMIGLGIVAVPAGLVASAFGKIKSEEQEKKDFTP